MIRHDGNTPFSTLQARPGSPRKSSSVQLLGQFHRWILYGGATLFTILALIAAVIAIAMYADNFIHAQRLLFDGEQRQVELTVVAANAKMRQTIVHEEFLRQRKESEVGKKSTSDYVPLTDTGKIFHFKSNLSLDGATINETNPYNSGLKDSIIITTSNVAKPCASLSHLLTQFYDASPNVLMSHRPAVQGSYVMLYDKKKTFLGLHVPQTEVMEKLRRQPKQSTGEIRAEILKAIAPIEAALEAIPIAQLRAGKTVWIAPYNDQLSGKLVISRAAVTFHDNTAFSVLVISVPVDRFDQYFLLQPLPPGFAVIASNGVTLSGKVSDTMAKQSLSRINPLSSATQTRTHPILDIFTDHASLITLTHPIRDTGWTMVYTFNWSMLWNALHHRIYFALGLAFMLSIILWTIVILFNRLVFIPVIREALRVHDSEAFNRAMMGVAPLGFFVLNYRTGELMLDNEQGRNVARLSHHSDQLTSFPQRLMTCYRNLGGANAGEQNLAHDVLELSAADGTCTYALAAFTRTRYLSNDVLLCCLSDITAQKYAERALQRAKAQADEANKAKSMFLALISHEIRTPLHGAAGHLELLELAPLPPSERDLVQTIRSSFESLLRTINDILDISRIEAGQLSLENAPFNLRQIVASCTHLWAPALEAKSIDFQCRIAAGVPDHLVGDAGRIVQILNNLLSNAVKFTHAGSVILDISGSPHVNGYGLQIGVRDSGVGIAIEDQKRLFMPFSQANPSIAREFGGTGLGLSLCKQLIDAMQGKITILSEYGMGTIVLVKLSLAYPTVDTTSPSDDHTPVVMPEVRPILRSLKPLTVPETSGLETIQQAPKAAVTSAIKMLVVEDDPVSRKLLQKQLFSLGHTQIDFVDNGARALALATTAPTNSCYDLILTDISLPQMSGFELILSLRQQGLSMPIIVVSASAENDQILAIRPQIDAFLIKPVSLSKLRAALTRYVSTDGPYKEASPVSQETIDVEHTPCSANDFGSSGVDQDVANIFLDTYRNDLRALIQAFQYHDLDALSGRLHRLKGALLAIKEPDLVQQSDRLCEDIRTNACRPEQVYMRKFVKELLRVVRHLRFSKSVAACRAH